MTSVRLPLEIENRLNDLCGLTHRPKSYYICEALTKYLEDMEDTYIALKRISNPRRKLLTTEELLKRLDE